MPRPKGWKAPVKSHHKTTTQTAGATATTESAASTAQTTNARNSRLQSRAIPQGALLDEALRLQGVINERQRLLDIAEGDYQRHIGRLCEHYRLDPDFDWHLSAGFMIPSERVSVSGGMSMTAGQSRS